MLNPPLMEAKPPAIVPFFFSFRPSTFSRSTLIVFFILMNFKVKKRFFNYMKQIPEFVHVNELVE
jgi:hypothetical protein